MVLSTPPSVGEEVTISVTSSDGSKVTVSPASLTFNNGNWDTPQTVTATAVTDTDGMDETVTVNHVITSSTSSDYPTSQSVPSVTVNVNDDENLAKPANVQATGMGVNALQVSWDQVTNATGYKVQWKSGSHDYPAADETAATHGQVTIDGGTTVTRTIASLTGGTTYTIRVIATAANYDDSEPSDEATGTLYANPAPGIPGSVQVMALVDSLQVSWSAATDADGYKVQWKSGSESYDSAREVTTTGTSIKIRLVGETQTTYTVRVIATRTNAPDGAASAEMTGTPTFVSADLSALTLVQVTPTSEPATTSYKYIHPMTRREIYPNLIFPSFTLKPITTLQQLEAPITGVADFSGEYSHFVCADKRNEDPYETNTFSTRLGCRRFSPNSHPNSITLTQAEIDHGGVMWHIWDGENELTAAFRWIPIPASSEVTLNPTFAAATVNYTGTILSTSKDLRITPTAASNGSIITVSFNSATSDTVDSGNTHVDTLQSGTNTVKIMVSGSNSKTYTVTLSADLVPTFSTSAVSIPIYTSGVAISPFRVPEATGGNGTLTYEATGLFAGLTFDADGSGSCTGSLPRTICGTPAEGGDRTAVISATDSDGDRVEWSINIRVRGLSITSTNPATLTELNLSGAKVTLTLHHSLFTSGGKSPSDFELVTNIPGVSISGVTTSGNEATLTLSFTDDFDTAETLAVTLRATAHQLSGDLTSGTVTVNPSASVTVSPTSLDLEEANQDTYTVALTTAPSNNVVIGVTSSDTDKVTVNPASLTFTTMNWNTAQAVTVTAVADADGRDESETVSHRITTAAGDYTTGLSIDTVSVNVNDAQTLGKPTNVMVTAFVDSLQVSWDQVTGVTGYKVQWKSGRQEYNTGDRQATTASGNDTTHTITGLAGTAYTIRVIATATGYDDSEASDPATGTIKPGKPTNVQVTALIDSLQVSWNAVTGATGYKVQWKSGGDGYDSSREETTTSASVKIRLTGGTEYTVRVIASANTADSAPSDEQTGTPWGAGPPGEPTAAPTVTSREKALYVSWVAGVNADGYKVQWKSGSHNYPTVDEASATHGQHTVTGHSNTTYTITGLTLGTTYTIRVISTRVNAEDSDPSDSQESSGTPFGASITSTVPATLDEVNLHGAKINLSLSDLTFVRSLATNHFELVPAISGLSISNVGTGGGTAETVLTLSFTGDFNTAQTLAVKVLAAGHSGSSGDLTTDTVPVSLFVGVIVSESSLDLEEDPGADNANRGTYTVKLGTEPSGDVEIAVASDITTFTVNPDTLTFTMTNWSTAQTVTVIVGTDRDGLDYIGTLSHSIATQALPDYPTSLSIPGVSVNVNDASVLAKPTNVMVTAFVDSLQVSWDQVTEPYGRPFQYKVQWKAAGDAYDPASREYAVGGTDTTITGLTGGTTYNIRVIATSTFYDDDSEASDEATGIPLRDVQLGKPSIVMVTPSLYSLEVFWNQVTDATGYKVQWKTGDDDYNTGDRQATISVGSDTTHTITGLVDGTTYEIRVIATLDHTPDSPPSDGVSRSTRFSMPGVDPSPPVVTPQVNALKVSWIAGHNADGYKVQWKSGSQAYPTTDASSATHGQATVTGHNNTTYTITGLTPGTAYTIRVISTRANADDSDPTESTEVQGTPYGRVTIASTDPATLKGGQSAWRDDHPAFGKFHLRLKSGYHPLRVGDSHLGFVHL